MSLETASLTLASASGDSLATVATQNGSALGDKSILHMIVTNTAGNGVVQIGLQFSGSFTTTPWPIADGAVLTIGPFSGAGPLRTKEVFFKGTAGKILSITIISF